VRLFLAKDGTENAMDARGVEMSLSATADSVSQLSRVRFIFELPENVSVGV
jgi:hypothetical protein